MCKFGLCLAHLLMGLTSIAAETASPIERNELGIHELRPLVEPVENTNGLVPFDEYYLELGGSISVVLGITGISVGSLMAGASCMGTSEQAFTGLCIAGISTASGFGLLFVCGSLAAGACHLYNYYLDCHNNQRIQ